MVAPEIMYLDEQKCKKYVEVSRIITAGSGRECEVLLPAISAISSRHLLFYRGEEADEDQAAYYAKNIGQASVFVHHVLRNRGEMLSPGEKRKIGMKASFTFGRAGDVKSSVTIFWHNPEAEEDEEDIHYVRLQPRSSHNEASINQAQSLLSEYFRRLANETPDVRAVCRMTARFLLDTFKLATVAIYQKAGVRWTSAAVVRANAGDTYRPSTTLFRRALEEKIPLLVRIDDGEVRINEEASVSTLSIVESPARRVILFPINQGGSGIAMVYLDTKEESLDQREFDILSRIMHSGVAALLAGYLAEDRSDLSFVLQKEVVLGNYGWRLLIHRDRIAYPVLGFLSQEDLGRANLIYGSCGDSLRLAALSRSFAMGLQANLSWDAVQLDKIKEFAERQDQNAQVNVASIRISLPSEVRQVAVASLPDEQQLYQWDKHNVRVEFIGDTYVYASKGGMISKVTSCAGSYDFDGVGIGDFLLVSPLGKISERALDGFSDSKLRKYCRDFVYLVREK